MPSVFSACRKTAFLVLLLMPACLVQAQLPKTLLWRLDAPGRTQPSYLFGTMHLSDKRLFNLDDSVYAAIAATEGTAIELSPDDMMAYTVNKIFDEMGKAQQKLSEVLDAETYRRYAPALAKKLGKPGSDLTASDVISEKNRWTSDYLAKGEMPTFLDAYLYNLARQQGKWLGGIEDMADQADLLDNALDPTDMAFLTAPDGESAAHPAAPKDPLTPMVALYNSQDIGQLYDFAALSQSGYLGTLNRRNGKMARRMDSLSAARPMFFAVGAAHLAGDSGVIARLRERGFAVTPVYGSRKIPANRYQVKAVPLLWHHVTVEQDLYEADMPGRPTRVKMYGFLESQVLFDLFSMTGYYAMAVPVARATNPDSLYNATAQRIFKGKKYTRTAVKNSGLQGQEYAAADGQTRMRIRLFASGNLLYMAMVHTLRKEAITGPDANRFFNSLRIHPGQEALQAGPLLPYSSPAGTIAFQTPVALSYSSPLSSDDPELPWTIRTYTGTDLTRSAFIMLTERKLKPGYILTSDSAILPALCDAMTEKLGAACEEHLIEGHPGRSMRGKKEGAATRALMTSRGNQTTLLMTFVDSTSDDPYLEQVFSSVRFLPRAEAASFTQQPPDSTFSTTAPGDPGAFWVTEETHRPHGVAYDSANGSTYSVVTDTLHPYFWTTSTNDFWAKQRQTYTDGTVLYERTVHNGADEGREWLCQSNQSTVVKRVRAVLHGRVLYVLATGGDTALVRTPAADRFFTDFSAHTRADAFDLTADKTEALLTQLASPDATVSQAAYQALDEVAFTATNQAALHQALLRQYPAIDTAWQTENIRVNYSLAEVAGPLDAPANIRFVQQQYPALQPKDSSLREPLLHLLANTRTPESYEALARLLNTTPAPADLYYLRYQLSDSLALLQATFPGFEPLLRQPEKALLACGLAQQLADSGLLQPSALPTLEADLTALAALRLAQPDSEAHMGDYDLVRLLGHLHTPQSRLLLHRYLRLADHHLGMQAGLELLRAGDSLTATEVAPLAADSTVCLTWYSHLEENNRLDLFPKKYRTQLHFAAAALYEAAVDDELTPARIAYIGKRTRSLGGKTRHYHLYKVTWNTAEGTETHLGIAGGYAPDALQPDPENNQIGFYWSGAYDKAQTDAQLSAYLETSQAPTPSDGD